MLRSAAVLLLSLLVPMAASAAPAALTDQQMDYITAGGKGHHQHHDYGLELFGGTKFLLKGKKVFKHSDFVQRDFDIGKFADLAAGVAYGWGVAIGPEHRRKGPFATIGPEHRRKGPFARSKSFVGVKPYKGKIVSFRQVSKEIHGQNRFVAWTASAAAGVAVGVNKYFHKLNRWEQRKALKVIQHVAGQKLDQAKAIAASHLRPPPLLQRLR